MKINLIDEYNTDGHLVYIENFTGAFVRGKTIEECINKLPDEIKSYCLWANIEINGNNFDAKTVEKKLSSLNIRDADSDIIFNSEKEPLTQKEYEVLKAFTLKSAQDFLSLYLSVPDKYATTLLPRETFYGQIPRTANEMYLHTKNVNNYYFSEIDVFADNEPDIYLSRLNGFKELEHKPDFLKNKVFLGTYDEQWSIRKLFRRFIWHDRIHAKAMYRMATKLYGSTIKNPFYFN